MSRLFPRPALSLAIFLLWAALTNASSLATLVLGALLGVLIPLSTLSFWPASRRAGKPGVALRLMATFLLDVLVANWAVASRVLGPIDRLTPRMINVPLDMDEPFVVTILASIVSLTPGTVSVDADCTRRILTVHALDAPDVDAVIHEIKTRYEAPLKEIFSC